MNFNEELYQELLEEEKQEKKLKEYKKLCLKNQICPDCNSQLTRQQNSDSYLCHNCGFYDL